MGTLKAFLKEKNKKELIDDLKQLQQSLDSSESKGNKEDSSKKEKKNDNAGILSSFTNKFKKKS